MPGFGLPPPFMFPPPFMMPPFMLGESLQCYMGLLLTSKGLHLLLLVGYQDIFKLQLTDVQVYRYFS